MILEEALPLAFFDGLKDVFGARVRMNVPDLDHMLPVGALPQCCLEHKRLAICFQVDRYNGALQHAIGVAKDPYGPQARNRPQ